MPKRYRAIVEFGDPGVYPPHTSTETILASMLTYGTKHQEYYMSVVEVLSESEVQCLSSDDGTCTKSNYGEYCYDCGMPMEEN